MVPTRTQSAAARGQCGEADHVAQAADARAADHPIDHVFVDRVLAEGIEHEAERHR